MTATTVLTTWVQTFQGGDADPRHAVTIALEASDDAADAADAADFDVDALTTAWVEALNAELSADLHLASNGEVYGPDGWDGDAGQELRDAVEAVDFWAIAERCDRTAADA